MKRSKLLMTLSSSPRLIPPNIHHKPILLDLYHNSPRNVASISTASKRISPLASTSIASLFASQTSRTVSKPLRQGCTPGDQDHVIICVIFSWQVPPAVPSHNKEDKMVALINGRRPGHALLIDRIWCGMRNRPQCRIDRKCLIKDEIGGRRTIMISCVISASQPITMIHSISIYRATLWCHMKDGWTLFL